MPPRRLVPRLRVRPIEQRDYKNLLAMLVALWPKESTRDHGRQIRSILKGAPRSTLPLTMFVAERGDALAGFVEVGLRSHANGCDPIRAVGFIEGWYVQPRERRKGVGRALFAAAERWCRSHGCREMASDTWSDHRLSVKAHTGLGYAVEGTFVNFRKNLRPSVKVAIRGRR
jgi:aminoglycoside 6'-N-acetyltransferase I